MNIIHIANGDYPRYEELLLQRDQLKKEANLYRLSYIRIFGGVINDIFKKYISCIELKKSIAYCQTAKNHRSKPDLAAMKIFVEQQMTAYRKKLHEMLTEYDNAKASGTVTDEELREIKSLYRKLAKQLHPDISPLINNDPTLRELWERACAAYNGNDLETLRETEFLVWQALAQEGEENISIVIPDIQEKIIRLERQIYEIKATEPYIHKFLLENKFAVAKKMQSLKKQLGEYAEYEEQLRQKLNEIKKEVSENERNDQNRNGSDSGGGKSE